MRAHHFLENICQVTFIHYLFSPGISKTLHRIHYFHFFFCSFTCHRLTNINQHTFRYKYALSIKQVTCATSSTKFMKTMCVTTRTPYANELGQKYQFISRFCACERHCNKTKTQVKIRFSPLHCGAF